MKIQQAIQSILDGNNLSRSSMREVFSTIFSGDASDVQIAGFLIALRMKGETIDEITAAAQVMQDFSVKVDVDREPLIDIVGTGGDGLNTINISTASAMVVAAAGGYVAKHGNRAASSQCGSADLLEHAGAKIDLNAQQVEQCLRSTGVGFMFAPVHHGAMKHAISTRRQLGVRTIFNVLGPLTNPAGTKKMVVGVYHRDLCLPIANVLKELGCDHVMVVHGEDGMDEISVGAFTYVAELKNNSVSEYMIRPEDFGLSRSDVDSIVVQSAAQSLKKIKHALEGWESAARDAIQLNSGAAIYVSGLASSLEEGMKLSNDILHKGGALKKLDEYVKMTNTFVS